MLTLPREEWKNSTKLVNSVETQKKKNLLYLPEFLLSEKESGHEVISSVATKSLSTYLSLFTDTKRQCVRLHENKVHYKRCVNTQTS